MLNRGHWNGISNYYIGIRLPCVSCTTVCSQHALVESQYQVWANSLHCSVLAEQTGSSDWFGFCTQAFGVGKLNLKLHQVATSATIKNILMTYQDAFGLAFPDAFPGISPDVVLATALLRGAVDSSDLGVGSAAHFLHLEARLGFIAASTLSFYSAHFSQKRQGHAGSAHAASFGFQNGGQDGSFASPMQNRCWKPLNDKADPFTTPTAVDGESTPVGQWPKAVTGWLALCSGQRVAEACILFLSFGIIRVS